MAGERYVEVTIDTEDVINVGGAVDYLTKWLQQGPQPVLNREVLANLRWRVNELVSFCREILDNSDEINDDGGE